MVQEYAETRRDRGLQLSRENAKLSSAPDEPRARELTSDARELGQVVDDRVASMDMIVDERHARQRSLAPQHRNTRERHPTWPNDLLRAVRVELCLLLL